jgi:hypothetical protein
MIMRGRAVNPTDLNPNYNTVFDWGELTWDSSGNAAFGHTTRLGGNSTEVDMFGIPMRLHLVGLNSGGPGPSIQNSGFAVSRPTILSAYLQLGPPWTNLFLRNSGGPLVRLRVISPYHGIALGLFPPKKLDSYINQVFTFYAINTLTATASCPHDGGIVHTLAGNTNPGGSHLVFKEAGAKRFMFEKPNTLTVYQNGISAIPAPDSPATPNLNACLGGVVAAKLGGAFIRTTLLTNTNLDTYCTTPTQFYLGVPIQKYAQIFHTYAINHLAYSFGYDDSCNQSSYINVDNPSSMKITLGGGGG